ncbi:MAG: hypothetical protein JWP57_2442 [Spirosoma sp.]|nr:hypothetical protein [Spirosoma sp.]
MALKTVHLTIPSPCQQRWMDMKAEEQGRFCGSCQKTVVDYSSLTNEQLIKLLARKDGSACGRFRINQLNRELTVTTSASQPFVRLFGLLTASLLGYQTVQADALPSVAKSTTQPISQSPIITLTPPSNGETALTDSVWVIRGRVIDQSTNTAFAGVTVFIKETSTGANTDADGRFQISVPTERTGKLVTLQIASIGYLSQEIQLRSKQTDSLVINLNEDSMALNQVIVIGTYKKLTFFQRLRNRLQTKH